MTSVAQSPAELLEAWGDVVPTYDSDWVGDAAGAYGLMTRYQRSATTLHDRSDGRFLPVYQTEFDLAVIRALGRTLAVMAPGLVGGLRNMCNYTIGEGYSFTVTKEATSEASDVEVAPLLKAVQLEVNTLLDSNDFLSGFDREIHDTSIIDGESFLYVKQVEDGVRIVRCEPDQIRQPAGARELEDWIQDTYGIPCDSFVSSWSFGVHTRADQPDTPLGYHVVADESGVDWEYVPAERMVHIKRNVTRNAKRGFSDFYPIEADSTRGEKLRRNMAEGAAIQSAIAFVRQHVAGTTRTGVEQLLGDNKVGTNPQSLSGMSRPRTVVQYRPGTVVDLSAGLEYKPGPLGSERANDFLLVASYVQRMQAVRWSMPEYMFSGDASNANYASTMEATAPFVKSCEAEQRFYSRHFVSLLWKALKIRWEMGAFDHLDVCWECLEGWLKIKAECPEVATRDELQNVQRQEILIRLGILSRKTAATQNGLDYDAEVANGASPEGQQGGSPEGQTAGPEADGTHDEFGGVPPVAPDSDPDQESRDADPLPEDLGGDSLEDFDETVLMECGGKGGKPGPCAKHLAKPPSSHRPSGKQTGAATLGKATARASAPGAASKSTSKSVKPTVPSAAKPTPPPKSKPVTTAGKAMPAKASSAVDPSSANAPTTSKRARKGTKTEKSRKEAVAKSEKSPTKKVDAEVQRFCEEGNERGVAKRVRGKALRDNEPIDIEVRDKTGALKHGVEVKTLVFRKASRIKVDPAAQDRKRKWHQKNKGVPFHTIVYDDRLVFNAKGPGKHDYSKRIVYYRRGYGSFALSKMHRITGGNKELRALMEKPYHQLPKGAKTPAKRSKRPPARAIAPRRKR